MNLTIRFSRLLVGAAVLGAILTPAAVAGAQVGPDDLTDDLCQPELEDCSPDECPEALEIVSEPSLASPQDGDDCPEPCVAEDCPEPCEGGGQEQGDAAGGDCPPEPCTDEPGCPGPDPDPDPDPYDPPVVGQPNFTG